MTEREYKLLAALEFYAYQHNWQPVYSKGRKMRDAAVDNDLGKRAREAIKDFYNE